MSDKSHAPNEALGWARRWARRTSPAEHELLEVAPGATLEQIRAAYHKLARLAHPDLHRVHVSAEELEEITTAFARVSNAYSMMTARLRKSGAGAGAGAAGASPAAAASAAAHRAASAPTRSGGAVRPPVVQFSDEARPAAATAAASVSAPATSAAARAQAQTNAPANAPASAPSNGPAIGAASAGAQLSAKAKMHYRRAELCLRRGELVEARLHLRLALATDPQSSFLRQALEEIDRG